MPEERQSSGSEQQAQGTTLRVHERDVKISYANICLLFSTREEMILDFGLTFPSTSQDQPGPNMLVSDRIVMSFPGAKRLAVALSQAIQQYESMFGVIQLETPPLAQPRSRPMPATS